MLGLIDPNDLLKALNISERCSDCPRYEERCKGHLKWVCTRIVNATTIEAEPIKHGRWKHHQYGNTAGYYECDNCGKINSYKSNYCPKCGADMRGGENETDIR